VKNLEDLSVAFTDKLQGYTHGVVQVSSGEWNNGL